MIFFVFLHKFLKIVAKCSSSRRTPLTSYTTIWCDSHTAHCRRLRLLLAHFLLLSCCTRPPLTAYVTTTGADPLSHGNLPNNNLFSPTKIVVMIDLRHWTIRKFYYVSLNIFHILLTRSCTSDRRSDKLLTVTICNIYRTSSFIAIVTIFNLFNLIFSIMCRKTSAISDDNVIRFFVCYII